MSAEDRQQQGDAANRRQAPRAELDYDVEVDIEGENVPYTGLLKDISEGGVFLTTDERHTIGDRLHIRFSFPTIDEPIDVDVVVRWVRDAYSEGGMLPGVGVQFVDLVPEVTAKINQFIRDKEVTFYDEGF